MSIEFEAFPSARLLMPVTLPSMILHVEDNTLLADQDLRLPRG